eukprot:sb/3477733/
MTTLSVSAFPRCLGNEISPNIAMTTPPPQTHHDNPPLSGATVTKVGFYLMVGWHSGIRIFWNGGTQIYVKAEPSWSGKLEGLCGNYNTNPKDDYKKQVTTWYALLL